MSKDKEPKVVENVKPRIKGQKLSKTHKRMLISLLGDQNRGHLKQMFLEAQRTYTENRRKKIRPDAEETAESA